jgi:hypothetical protein
LVFEIELVNLDVAETLINTIKATSGTYGHKNKSTSILLLQKHFIEHVAGMSEKYPREHKKGKLKRSDPAAQESPTT